MSSSFKLFIKRVLIFQFAFLFICSKVTNINKNIKDFTKRIKYIAKNIPLSVDKIELIESKSDIIFITMFSTYFFMTLLSLMNISIGKQFCGMMTMIMALIYCNPLTTIKKNYEKNNNQVDWKIYIPSIEFCVISCLGFAMLLSTFYSNEEEEKEIKIPLKANEKKENEIKERKEKIN